CQAKIHHFYPTPAIKHQIFGLDVAVDNVTLFVCRVERVGDLGGVFGGQMLRHHCIDLQQAADSWPLHELHDEIEKSALLPGVKDLHDIRMIQASDDLGFADEARHIGGIFSEAARQYLNCYLASKRDLLAAIHHPHGAASNFFFQQIAAQALACQFVHALCSAGTPNRCPSISSQCTLSSNGMQGLAKFGEGALISPSLCEFQGMR